MESVKAVEDQAAEWLVRRDAGNWTASDQAELERWLQASTAHVVAFIRLETAWQRTHRLKFLGDGSPRSPDEQMPALVPDSGDGASARREGEHSSEGKPRRFIPLLAAGVLVTVALAFTAASLWPTHDTSFRTPVGGIAAIPMSDGSKIVLNTDSEIRVEFTESQRHVQLEHGEAFFAVAKDSARPFIVSVGNKRVVAVGTAFSVRRENDDMRVVVTEGKVRIEKGDRNEVLLQAGSIARARRDQVVLEQKPQSELDAALSWRDGFLTFRETTLPDAIAEFNRYNERKIVLRDDSALAAIRLSGKFQATQYQAFVRLLEASYQLRAHDSKDRIVLSIE